MGRIISVKRKLGMILFVLPNRENEMWKWKLASQKEP